jgi:hypothetical protein
MELLAASVSHLQHIGEVCMRFFYAQVQSRKGSSMHELQEDSHMDSMDNFRERIDALEQQMKVMGAHTRTVERRLRWWRGIACGVMLLGLVSLPLQSGTAADTQPGGMAERMATVENKLSAMAFDGAANEVVITGANLRIVNGLGATDTTNGLGNLIVGYNELRDGDTNTRTGSHNVVVGKFNNFSSFGGVVVGFLNEISGTFASVSGGSGNIASGTFASVSGGANNTASGPGAASSVSGGLQNTASGNQSSVSGGHLNTARSSSATVSGGNFNTASDRFASVTGGDRNTASGGFSSVNGGENNTASGQFSSVSGGENNTASGQFSSVSGGSNRTAPGTDDWAAGPLFADN